MKPFIVCGLLSVVLISTLVAGGDPFSMGPPLAEQLNDNDPFSMGPPLGSKDRKDVPTPEPEQVDQ